jgi:hypothetical protein
MGTLSTPNIAVTTESVRTTTQHIRAPVQLLAASLKLNWKIRPAFNSLRTKHKSIQVQVFLVDLDLSFHYRENLKSRNKPNLIIRKFETLPLMTLYFL